MAGMAHRGDVDLNSALAAHVRAEVAAAGWTRAEAQARFGLDPSSYRRYFIAEDRSPRFDVVLRIAVAFGMAASAFIRDVEARAGRVGVVVDPDVITDLGAPAASGAPRRKPRP